MGVRQNLQLRTGRLASFQDSVVRVSDDDENFDGVRHLRAWVCRGVDQCVRAHACVRMRLLACIVISCRCILPHACTSYTFCWEAEVEVDADVFSDFLLSFDYTNRARNLDYSQEVDWITKFCRPLKFVWVILVHLAGVSYAIIQKVPSPFSIYPTLSETSDLGHQSMTISDRMSRTSDLARLEKWRFWRE